MKMRVSWGAAFAAACITGVNAQQGGSALKPLGDDLLMADPTLADYKHHKADPKHPADLPEHDSHKVPLEVSDVQIAPVHYPEGFDGSGDYYGPMGHWASHVIPQEHSIHDSPEHRSHPHGYSHHDTHMDHDAHMDHDYHYD